MFIVGCAQTQPTIEEARADFYEAIEKARQRPCVPDYVERAYDRLVSAVVEDDTEEAWDEFVGVDEQTMDQFKQGVCR